MKQSLTKLLIAGICGLGISGTSNSAETVRLGNFMVPMLTLEVSNARCGSYDVRFYDAGADGLDRVVKGDGEVISQEHPEFWIYETAYDRKLENILNKVRPHDPFTRVSVSYFEKDGKKVLYDSFGDGYVSWLMEEDGEIVLIDRKNKGKYQEVYEKMLEKARNKGVELKKKKKIVQYA